MNFSELGLDQGVMDALEYMKYGQCTPVQEKAIPPVLNGDDVIAVAQTGTGKTAAYLLPILSNLNRYRYPTDAINCVIMAPTRELAHPTLSMPLLWLSMAVARALILPPRNAVFAKVPMW